MTYEMACEQYQREAEYWCRYEKAVLSVMEELNEDGELDGLDDEEAWERAEEEMMRRAERWAD